MIVDVYEQDTVTLALPSVDLRDVLGDDDSEDHDEIVARLQREGRAWVGGGAAPLFYLKPEGGS